MHNLGWLVETMLLATSRNNKLWHCDISYLRKRWQLQIPTKNLAQIKKYLLLITNTLFYILNVYKFDYMSYPKETVWSRKYMYTFVYMFCFEFIFCSRYLLPKKILKIWQKARQYFHQNTAATIV